MRGLFSQVLAREGSGDPPLARQEPDPDTVDAMGCFASPKRLGHHGSIGDVCVLSYEPINGLMAVASRGGMIKVFGGPGVELVLEEEGTSIAGEDPPAHLLFPMPTMLAGVTATGAVLAWDLAAGGRCGSIPSPLDPATGLEERVTSVHGASASAAASNAAGPEAQGDRYIFTGFESGRVRVTQVFPVCRASGYTVEPRETSFGAPEELLAPSDDSGRPLGAVTCISYFGDRGDGGGIGVFGHRYGGIVVWDWVRRKRLALRGLARPSHRGADEQESQRGGGDEDEEGDREVSSLAFHPSGEVFAAGFTSGCYAIFSVSSSSSHKVPQRWVQEVGDDGSCPREGPTIVRTAVSLVQWVRVCGAGTEGAWGLVVAGGVEMEEGEEPDGVSLLVPSPASRNSGGGSGGGGGGGRAKKEIVGAAMAALETAVFVPFAIGQERLSHVHCVVCSAEQGVATTETHGWRSEETPLGSTGQQTPAEQESPADASEELVIMGLVKWNEEIRGDDGRLHFRLASSILACPIQTSPYVALLQLSPEKFGPNVGGFAAVTAMASTPLLSSSTILDFVTCLGDERAGEGQNGGSPALSSLLRGGHLRWPDSIPPRSRDEALCTSELLVAGHSDGLLTFWECCGPASRQDAVAISEGRVVMREVPSGALLLGSVPVAELAGEEDGAAGVAVSALDVWVERDHVAAAARNACWVAVGLDNGDATVIVLANRMEAGSNGSNGGFGSGGGGGKADSSGGTPLVEKPVEVSDVQLRDGTIEGSVGGSGGGGLLKRFVKRGGGRQHHRRQQQSPGDAQEGVEEDAELEAAIAEARAEARAIAAREESTGGGGPEKNESLAKRETGEQQEGGDSENQGSKDLRQELLEAMAEEGAAVGDDSGAPASPPRPTPPRADDTPDEEAGGEEGGEKKKEQPLCLDAPRRASLVQLSLRLHSLSVQCVALSFDTAASALALVVADEGGVVSVTDISTGSASLLPMRVPQSRPCRPSVAIGPLPGALSGGRVPPLGGAGALYVLLEGWLNVFDLASRDPVDFVQVPGLEPPDNEAGDARGGSGGADDAFARCRGRAARSDEGEGKSWLACVDERGLPLLPYASESFCSSFSPLPAPCEGEGGGGGGGEGGGCDDGEPSGGRIELEREDLSFARTIWVNPPPSRTALDDYHEHELQVLNNSPPPEPFLLVVRGGMALVLAIARRDAESVSSVFSRRSSQPSTTNAAAFKGRSGAELIVKSVGTLPRAEGHPAPPRVDGAGVCLVPAGKGPDGRAARRGCLVAADSSGFVTALLLPSLCPVFRDRIPASGGVRGGGVAALGQESVCNLLGELTHLGMAGELTRWSLLVDEACDTLTGSNTRLVKVSALTRPPAMSRQSSGGGGSTLSAGSSSSSSSSISTSTGAAAPKGRSARGMLGRLSLGGSKKSVSDVFAVEPSPRRQPLARNSSAGGDGGGFGSTRSSFSSSAGGAGPVRAAAAGRSALAQAQDQREALFGERQAGDGATAARDGGAVGGARGGVSGTHAAVSEARDLAIERGEKLENLVDRSRQLEDSAMAFGDMAKQLRRQQEDESCCVS
eukprot:g6426.t1